MSVNVKTSEGLTKIANNVSIVQANWNETDENKNTHIKNKPEVLTTMEELEASTNDSDLVGAGAVKEVNDRLVIANAERVSAYRDPDDNYIEYSIHNNNGANRLKLRIYVNTQRVTLYKIDGQTSEVMWDNATPKTFTATAYGLTLVINKVGRVCEWKLSGTLTEELLATQYYTIADLLGTGFEPATTYVNIQLLSHDINGQVQARKYSNTKVQFEIGYFKKASENTSLNIPANSSLFAHGMYMSAN